MPWLIVVMLAFVCGFFMDVTWAACINAVTYKRPLMAANLSAALYVCTIVSTVLVVERCFAAVAAYVIGGWLGTYLVVARRARRPQ